MTICSDDVIEHLTKLGYNDAVNEINKLLAKERMDNIRWRRYFHRLIEFAKNFGAYSIVGSSNTIDLQFEYCDMELEKLAKLINGSYYQKYDEDSGYENDSEIIVNRRWFENIMHLWINIYKDQNFDIYQQRFNPKTGNLNG